MKVQSLCEFTSTMAKSGYTCCVFTHPLRVLMYGSPVVLFNEWDRIRAYYAVMSGVMCYVCLYEQHTCCTNVCRMESVEVV